MLVDTESDELAAYFALTPKIFTLGEDAELSKNLRKKFGFGRCPEPQKPDQLSCVLLAQLGKNDEYKGSFSIEEIMHHCMAVVREIHGLVGGQVLLVECEQQPKLRKMYESNGFKYVQDCPSSSGEMLHQLFRTLKF